MERDCDADFELDGCISIQTPDVGMKPARAQQISVGVRAIIYLEMLAQSALPHERWRRMRNSARRGSIRRSGCVLLAELTGPESGHATSAVDPKGTLPSRQGLEAVRCRRFLHHIIDGPRVQWSSPPKGIGERRPRHAATIRLDPGLYSHVRRLTIVDRLLYRGSGPGELQRGGRV